jgi:hypothetical protein
MHTKLAQFAAIIMREKFRIITAAITLFHAVGWSQEFTVTDRDLSRGRVRCFWSGRMETPCAKVSKSFGLAKCRSCMRMTDSRVCLTWFRIFS